ncbi:hypothetical protein B9Z55_013506 [Caenorhabditis nigoni]|uniref:Major sperm protein n=1 Tax=Caenorhabditis nigoni TaxID=1611254 RepID=A0A2G5U211_9PELO|nr:hypothetical protein B9Z55_013506 [Caenorhabditis nigoni]
MEATLEKIDGVKLFHCKTLGYVLRKGNLLPGNHLITAHLMSQSVVTTNGKIIHFEGTRTAAPKSPHKLMSKMSLAEPPKTGDIETGPASKLFLNSPFSKKIIAEIKITNPTAHRIGVGIKTNNRERFLVNPEFGVLDSKESIVVSITCKPFQFDPDEKYADKVKIGWLNAPRGAGKEFKKEWFEGKEKVLVKYLKIKYNP